MEKKLKEIACQIKGLEKAFGLNKVLRSIDLTLEQGSVTVLMGANGAGKSTLVKILCGVHEADKGFITLFGKHFSPKTPVEAFEKGVVTVHQAINDGVIPDLDVASNLMLDTLSNPKASFFISEKSIRAEARKVAVAMNINLNERAKVSSLGVADRQMIAIARAMARKPQVLILDEPTSSLSAKEAERLFELINHLRSTGVSILYISHRMSDIRAVADRIVTMRDGKISGIFEGPPLDYEGAVTAMLGQKMAEFSIDSPVKGELVLKLEDIRLSDSSPNINFSVHKNEVVVITGLLGSGKSKLASLLFGIEQPRAGKMYIKGNSYSPKSPQSAIRSGVHMSPKDRSTNAVITGFDIEKNLTLPYLHLYSQFSFLKKNILNKVTRNSVEMLGIVCQNISDDIETLSGGNQQKVVVGRWLSEPCELLVLDEPFQGVDIKARRDISKHIRNTAQNRATVVFVAELDEAIEIADRIFILNEQEIVGEHENKNINLALMLAQVSGQSVKYQEGKKT